MIKIVKTIFGSHLYGTETEDSDLDYKGVYLPSKEEILLNRIRKSIPKNTKTNSTEKNTKYDVDYEIYSLHYFIQLAIGGQTEALDMLHAPKSALLESSIIWDEIVRNRERFYTKNLTPLVLYSRKQAAKYGVKGSRLDTIKQAISILKQNNQDLKLKEIWNSLPRGEHISDNLVDEATNLKLYRICDRSFHETVKIGYMLGVLEKVYNEYGSRAKDAEENKGIDWKAVSHALRACYQIKEILTDRTITYPLKNAEFIRNVKIGKFHYKNEINPLLDRLMEEIEDLSAKSTLPEKAETEFWDEFIINTIEQYVL